MNQFNGSKGHDLAYLFLRIGVGVVFIDAGWGKLTGIEGTQDFFGNVGIPIPALMAWVVAIIEFVGGILVLAGAYIRIPALLLGFIMVVAIFTVKLGQDFSAMRVDLLLLLMCAALLVTKSGKYSADYFRKGDT